MACLGKGQSSRASAAEPVSGQVRCHRREGLGQAGDGARSLDSLERHGESRRISA